MGFRVWGLSIFYTTYEGLGSRIRSKPADTVQKLSIFNVATGKLIHGSILHWGLGFKVLIGAMSGLTPGPPPPHQDTVSFPLNSPGIPHGFPRLIAHADPEDSSAILVSLPLSPPHAGLWIVGPPAFHGPAARHLAAAEPCPSRAPLAPGVDSTASPAAHTHL